MKLEKFFAISFLALSALGLLAQNAKADGTDIMAYPNDEDIMAYPNDVDIMAYPNDEEAP